MNDMVSSHVSHRFTVAEYHRLYDARVFAPDARIELIDGELVESLVTMKPPHAAVVVELTRALMSGLGNRARVRSEVPITLGEFSEPEPDIAIVRTSDTKYRESHPGARDVFAIIEVADTSRAFDLGRKVPLYAALGIPETWVIDLVESRVHVFRKPLDWAYTVVTSAAFEDELVLEALSDLPIRISSLV